MVTCLPVSRSYCIFMSSRAVFKLAAANTTTSRGCCAMLGPLGSSHAVPPRLAIAPSSHRRRGKHDDAILLCPLSRYISEDRSVTALGECWFAPRPDFRDLRNCAAAILSLRSEALSVRFYATLESNPMGRRASTTFCAERPKK